MRIQEDDLREDKELEMFDIMSYEFELIEDETIDIDSIEELNDTCYDVNTMTDDDIEYYHNKTRTILNEVIRAVKQHEKEIKELKSLDTEISEKEINEALKKAREERSKKIKSIKEK